MSTGLGRVSALLLTAALLLTVSGVALAQGDKPGADPINPDSPASTIVLPATGSTNAPGNAFSITNSGAGRAGYFATTSTTNTTATLEARTFSTASGAVALSAVVNSSKPGANSAAISALNSSVTSNGYGIMARHAGAGYAVFAQASGAGGRGVYGFSSATSGVGSGVYGEAKSASGYGGYFLNTANNSTATALFGKGGYIGVRGEGGIGVYAVGGSAGVYASSNYNAVYAVATGTNGVGIYGSGNNAGVNGQSPNIGVSGEGGTYGVRGTGNTYGVYGVASNSSGKGVYGSGQTGVYGLGSAVGTFGHGITGVYGEGSNIGVYGNAGPYGLYGVSTSGSGDGVYGEGKYGVYGKGTSYGVYGTSTSAGVYGDAGTIGKGVYGHGATGVYGDGVAYGLYAKSTGTDSTGVYGIGTAVGVRGGGISGVYGLGSTTGVYGEGNTYGVFGRDLTKNPGHSWAGYFDGGIEVLNYSYFADSVNIGGNLGVDGDCYGCLRGPMRIENPLDSSTYVEQAGVISPERLGIYSGNAKLDANGAATVKLPAWFAAVYGDIRYNLTPIGDAAVLYVAAKISDDQFKIAGGKPGMEVSWQVSGVRRDQDALDHPLQNVVSKAAADKNLPKQPAVPMTDPLK